MVTDTAAAPVRVTFDVDLVARVTALAAYHGVEKEFVRLGFARDTAADAPICRWRYRASTDQHLWAKTYERDLKDTLALQDEIAQDVAEHIRVTLSPKERSLLIQVRAVDPEAHDALRGSYALLDDAPRKVPRSCHWIELHLGADYQHIGRCAPTGHHTQGGQAEGRQAGPKSRGGYFHV